MSISLAVQQRRRIVATRLFFFAGAALVLSALIPWVSVSGTGYLSALTYSTRPSSGAVVVLLAIAGGYGWAAWSLRDHPGSRRLALGMWIVDALVVSIVLANGSSLHDQQGVHVVAGGGYLAAFLAAGLGIAATIALHRSRARIDGGAEIDAQATAVGS